MLLSWALLVLLVLPLSATELPQVIFAQPDGSVMLPRKHKEKNYVRWYFGTDTEPLIWKNLQGSYTGSQEGWKNRVSLSADYSLLISPVKEDDFGYFTCKQQDKLVEVISNKYQLCRVIMPTTLFRIVGETLSLTCEVENVPVLPTITWKVPHNTDITYLKIKNGQTVIVRNVSYKHRGDWICEVKHDGLTFNAKTAVTILDLSPSPPDPIYTSVNSSPPFIPCSFMSDISLSMLKQSGLQSGSWHFIPIDSSDITHPLLVLNHTRYAWMVSTQVNSFLEEKTLTDHNLAVKISSKVSVQYRGTFMCSVQLKSDIKLSRNVTLEVLEVLSSDSCPHEGNTVNLTCTLGHRMPPDLEVKWIYPKTSLFITKGHSYHLSIPAVRVQDSGEWKCELRKNNTVLTTAAITLTIVPMDVRFFVAIGSGAFIFVLLLVITVIIFLRRQKKNRPRKRRFCCCKNPQAKGFYKT